MNSNITDVVFGMSTKRGFNMAKSQDGERLYNAVNIGHALDTGNINCDVYSPERHKELFAELEGYWDEQFFAELQEDYEKLLDTAKHGGHLRVWKCDNPWEACAFRFLCDVLRDTDCSVGVITMPDRWFDWGVMSNHQYCEFLHLEKQLTTDEKHHYSDEWRKLKTENTPLRAVVNGKLISVPESFYDCFIDEVIPNGEFAVSDVVGKTFFKYRMPVGDSHYLLRIKRLLDENKLEFVRDKNDHPIELYRKILRKVR